METGLFDDLLPQQGDPFSDIGTEPGFTPGDYLKGLKRGIQQIPGSLTGLADVPGALLTGERYADQSADKLGDLTGFKPGQWAKETKLSPGGEAAMQELDTAWKKSGADRLGSALLGNWDDLPQAWRQADLSAAGKAIVDNPGAAAMNVVESIPGMLVGGGIGKGLAVAGKVAPVVAGAAGEGIITAGQQMDQTDRNVNPRTAAATALAAGAGTGLIAGVGGKVAQRFGLEDVQTAMAGGRADDVGRGMAGRVGGGAVAEAGQEFLQSGQEQAWQNVAEGNPLGEGVIRSSLEGAIAGAVMGGGSNLLPARPQPVTVPRQDGQGEALIDPATGPLSAAAVDHVQRTQTSDDLFGDLMPAAPVASAIEPLVNVPETGDPFADLVPASPLQDFAAQVDPVSLDEAQALAAQADGVQVVAPHPAGDGYLLAPREWFQPEQIDLALQPGKQKATDPLAGRIQAVLDAYDTAGHPDNGKIIRAAMKSRAPTEQTVAFWEAQLDRNLRTWQSIAGQGQPVEAKLRTADDLWQGDREQTTRTFVPDDITTAVLARSNALVQQLAERGVHLDEVDSRFPADVSGIKKEESGLRGLFLRYAKQLEARAKGYKRFDPEALAKTEGELFQAIGYQPTIDQAAGTANTAPTEAQIAAGNYQKGHVKVGLLDVAIENPVGSTRTGPGWQTTMQVHYGYLKRTTGADGDQVDVYVRAGTPADHTGPVFVVDQYDAKTGKFDEHKAMVGYGNQAEAVAAYDQHFSDGSGPQRRRGVVEMSPEAFKAWAQSGDTKKPAYTEIEGDRPHALPETIRTALHRNGKTTRRPLGADGRSRSILAVRQAPEVPGLYRVSTQLVTVGERRLPLDRVANWDDAARTFSHLHRYAVEHLDALVTDAEGRPLANIGGFKGGTTYSSVSPGAVMMELATIEGAAGLWLAHNHPSGLAELSQADHNLSKTFADILQDSGITYHGLAAITRNGEAVAWKNTDDATGTVPRLQKAPHRLPLVEREIVESEPGETVTSPAKAKALVAELAKDQTGVVFLTAQNQVASFVPFDTAEMSELRQGDRLMRLFRAASQSGAVSAFVAIPDNKVTNAQFANLKGALGSIEIRVLDGIKYDSQTGQAGRSLAEEGRDTSAGLSFKAPSGIEPSSIDTEVSSLVSARRPIDKVLAHIAAHSSKPINRALAQALQRKGLQTQVMAAEQPTPGIGGIYDGKANTIELHTASGAEQLFLHEAVHAATVQAIGQNGIAARQLRRLLWQVRDQLGQDTHYGLKNVPEFIAEAMTNRQFQDALREIPVANSRLGKLANAWREFVSILRGLLGLEKGQETALSRAIELGARLLEANDDTKAGDGQYFSLIGQATNQLHDLFANSGGTFNWLHKTVGTQYHKAQIDRHFKRVFDLGQNYLLDTSRFAMDAADKAPSLLMKLESLRDIFNAKAAKRSDVEAIADPLFAGTLESKTWSNAELRERFGLNATQIVLFREARAAVGKSLDDLGISEMAQVTKAVLPGIDLERVKGAELVTARDYLHSALNREADIQRLSGDEDAAKVLESAATDVLQKAKHIVNLKAEGYMPLMRFGKFAVDVVEADGERQFFGMYETRREANQAARALQAAYPTAGVTQGQLDTETWRLFQGLDPSSLEVFAKALGAEEKAIYQDFLKLTINNRSAMKRLLAQKGTEGYSRDVQRILASFVTSNARLAAKNYHFGDLKQAVLDIPKVKGDVRNEAAKLVEYLQNPAQEEAAGLRGYLFVHFLGGSVASALVNMTQPLTMTAPYLAQYGNAATALAKAGKLLASGRYDAELRDAMQLAEREGITAPHELHQLYAESMQTLGRNALVRRGLHAWGSFFSLAEQFNRKLTFVAAFEMARKNGISDPFAFAGKAVAETQGVYNRGNRPNWARGAIGATVFTFKQFSIAYVEFLRRLWKSDKRAFAIAMAVLFVGAGAEGWPFAEDLQDLIDTVGQFAGFGTNSKAWLRENATKVFGELGGEIFRKGISALLPIDLSSRLGVQNLIPGSAMFKVSETDKTRDMLEFVGPFGGFVSAALKGFDAARMGDLAGAATMAAPVAIQNALKGQDMQAFGFYRDTKGRRVVDTDGYDAFAKAIGFQPNVVARESGKIREQQQNVAQHRAIESEIADLWAHGVFERDEAKVKDAVSRLKAWNERNPEMPIRIAPRQIGERVKAMAMSREQRFAKSVPKEMRGMRL